MTWVAALFVVAAFVGIAHLLRMVPRAQEVLARSRQAVADLRDPDLGEIERERAVQAHAGRLLLLFLILTASAAVALAVPFGAVALLDAAGVLSLDAVVDLTVSPAFLVGTIAGGFAAWWVLRRRRA